MNNSIITTAASLVLASAISGNVYAAENCKQLDPDFAVAKMMAEHAEGKVLKVEETIDAQGCVELNVRILVDGTVKVITIPNETGA